MTDADPIEAYVPHRGAALLVERLVEADAEHAVVEAVVPRSGAWVRDGAMPSWTGIELMAQAAAAWAGARARREQRPVALGFLLGTRRYETHCDAFPAGGTLRISVCPEFIAANGLGMFDCRIDVGERTLARAQLSVFEPADARPYLRGEAPQS